MENEMKNKREGKNPILNIYHDNIDMNKDRASLPRSMMVVGTTITSREKVLMKTYSHNFSVRCLCVRKVQL